MAAGIMRLLGEWRYYTVEVNCLHIYFVVSVILHINANLFSLVYLFIYIYLLHRRVKRTNQIGS